MEDSQCLQINITLCVCVCVCGGGGGGGGGGAAGPQLLRELGAAYLPNSDATVGERRCSLIINDDYSYKLV